MVKKPRQLKARQGRPEEPREHPPVEKAGTAAGQTKGRVTPAEQGRYPPVKQAQTAGGQERTGWHQGSEKNSLRYKRV